MDVQTEPPPADPVPEPKYVTETGCMTAAPCSLGVKKRRNGNTGGKCCRFSSSESSPTSRSTGSDTSTSGDAKSMGECVLDRRPKTTIFTRSKYLTGKCVKQKLHGLVKKEKK